MRKTLLSAQYHDRSEVLELSVGVGDGLSQVKGQTMVHPHLRVLIRRQNTCPRRQTKVRCEGQEEKPKVRQRFPESGGSRDLILGRRCTQH